MKIQALVQKACVLSVGIVTSLALSPTLLVAASEASANAAPLIAQGTLIEATQDSCVALQEVSTGATEVRKRIENRVVTRGNWNTDFLVPSDQEFSYFVAIVSPENSASYELTINLRLPTSGSEVAFSGRTNAEAGSIYSIPFQSPTGRQPAVVNARVGGVNGNVYTISVIACQ